MALFRAVVAATQVGQQVCNVLHFSKDGPWTDQLALQLAQHLRDNLLNDIRLRISNRVVWFGITVYDPLTPGRQPATLAINVAGAASTSAQNNNPVACVKIRLRTSQTGPHGRGRIYLPGAPSVDYADGLATANTITSWTAIFGVIGPKYIGSGATSGFVLCVAPKANPANHLTVIQIELAPTMGIQRRRNIGVGS